MPVHLINRFLLLQAAPLALSSCWACDFAAWTTACLVTTRNLHRQPHRRTHHAVWWMASDRLRAGAAVQGNVGRGVDPEANSEVAVKVIGVTGGIGSGKSTASRMIVSKLCPAGEALHLDADSIAHSLYEPSSPVVAAIQEAFGPSVVLESGHVDRPALGKIIFSDPKARQQVEDIVWPSTKEEVQKQIDSFVHECQKDQSSSSSARLVILEAALLLDAGWEDLLDAIWVVKANREVALDRLVHGERGLALDDAQRRMDAQAESGRNMELKLQQLGESGLVTTQVIDNSGDIDHLHQTLQAALESTRSTW